LAHLHLFYGSQDDWPPVFVYGLIDVDDRRIAGDDDALAIGMAGNRRSRVKRYS
jgi:hypothetical protein